MIKYVTLDKDGFIQTNSDVEFEGATKIIFQDDWASDFNRFYSKFHVEDNGVVSHPDNLPTDPITKEIDKFKQQLKEANDNLSNQQNIIKELQAKLKDVDLSTMQSTITELNEAEQKNDSAAINDKITQIGKMAMSAQSQLQSIKQQTNK